MKKNLEKKVGIPQKITEFGLGYLQGIAEHSAVLPTALRKDFTDAVKPNGIRFSGWEYSIRQAGYSMSFLNGCAIGWIVPVGLNALMYYAVSNIDNSLTSPIMVTQIGTNVASLLYEIGRGINHKESKKTKAKK